MLIKTFKSIGLSILYYLMYSLITSILSNLIDTYAIYTLLSSCIFILIMFLLYKDDLTKKFKSIKKDNKLVYIIYGTIMTILICVLDYVLTRHFGHSSTNQELMISLIKEDPLLMSISTVIFIPFAEELIFRYTYKKDTKYLGLLASTLIFAAIHMIGTKEIIFIIPYLLMSFTLTFTYFKTDNVYISYILHLINNLINVLLLIW